MIQRLTECTALRSAAAPLLGLVLLLFLAAFAATGCSNSEANGSELETADTGQPDTGDTEAVEDDAEPALPVRLLPARRGTVSSYITATANLVAENQVKILAESTGRIAQILSEEGDVVEAGQILATLQQDEERIALEKARVRETNARLAQERAKGLLEQELLSQEDFDNLSMDWEIARQELAEAEWQLSKTTIRAPFAGRVSERMIQIGQHVRPGDDLFQITDYDPLIARLFLPEKDILGLSEGRRVKITLNADPTVRFAGRIRQISPIVDTATGTVKLTVEATAPPPAVRPGSFVTIDVVRETRTNALVVPREAIRREVQQAHVFVALDGTARKRPVTLGLEEGKLVEITSGLEAGDQVVVTGQGGLKDGARITVVDSVADRAS